MVRRNYRFLVKWLLLAIASGIAFKFCCDSLVQVVLSTSVWPVTQSDTSNSITIYEDLLIDWAETGRRSQQKPVDINEFKPRDDLEFIGAQIFFRHGARTPLHLLPTLDEVTYGKDHIEPYPAIKWDFKLIPKIGDTVVEREKISSAHDLRVDGAKELKAVEGLKTFTGQLTAVGQRQLYELGRSLRSQLVSDDGQKRLLPASYDPKYVYCRSTFMNRTVTSARSFLAGLFLAEKLNNRIQANGPFEIEVHHFLDEDMFPNPRVAPILKNCLSATALYQSLHDSHDLKRARKAILKRIGLSDYTDGITELYDDIVSRQAHNFSVPEDILELAKEFEVMSARETIYRATSIGFDAFIRSTCGPLLYLMRENFQSILTHYIEEKKTNIEKPYQKLFIYSGHDTTIIPLAMAFEIFDMRWPPYATSILIKFYVSKSNFNDTYITVTYAGQPQILPDCPDYYCSYATFLNNLHGRFEKPKIPAAN